MVVHGTQVAKIGGGNRRKKHLPGISQQDHNVLWPGKVLRNIKIRYRVALAKFRKLLPNNLFSLRITK